MRPGADLRVEEIIKNMARKETRYAQDLKKGKIINTSGNVIDSHNKNNLGQIITPSSINKQQMNVNGHIISLKAKFKKSEFVSECYDEFLRMWSLADSAAIEGKIIRSTVSGKPVQQLKFEDWMNESRLTLLWRKEKELPKLKRANKISKDVYNYNMEIVSLGLEAIKEYLGAGKDTQLVMV